MTKSVTLVFLRVFVLCTLILKDELLIIIARGAVYRNSTPEIALVDVLNFDPGLGHAGNGKAA